MKSKGYKDERIVSESNRIFKFCFYILCAGIFADLIIKFSLWDFNFEANILTERGTVYALKNNLSFFVTMVLEGIFLLTAFLSNVFLLARKGILFGAAGQEPVRFPKKRYSFLSGSIALATSVCLWTVRLFLYGRAPYGLAFDILFAAFVYFVTAAVFFLFFMSIFFAAYRIAKRHLHLEAIVPTVIPNE